METTESLSSHLDWITRVQNLVALAADIRALNAVGRCCTDVVIGQYMESLVGSWLATENFAKIAVVAR